MADILQTTFLNEFYWMKLFKFWQKNHWNVFPSQGSNKKYASTDTDNDLAPNRSQVIIWINDGIVHLHIYTPFGLS